MKIWIVSYDTGYDASDIVGVFATEDLAKKFISSQDLWNTGYDSKHLDYCDYVVSENIKNF